MQRGERSFLPPKTRFRFFFSHHPIFHPIFILALSVPSRHFPPSREHTPTYPMEIDALTVLLTIAIAILIGYIKLNKTEPDVHPLLLNNQSNATPIRIEGESTIHRSRNVPLTSSLERQPSDKIKTLYDVWQAGLATNPTGRSLMYMLQNQFYYEDVSSLSFWRRIMVSHEKWCDLFFSFWAPEITGGILWDNHLTDLVCSLRFESFF
jgi:hypothetical protein